MNKLIKRLNKGEEKMKKKKMMSVIVAMMLVVGMLGCSKESGEGDTSKEKSTKEGYKFGFTEWAAGSFFDACYDGVMSVVEEKGGEVIRVEAQSDSNIQLGIIEDFIAQDVDCVFYNPVEAKAAIKKDGAEGIWKCTAAQSPFTVGQKSAEVAYKILEGKDFEKETLISTFAIDASNVSEYSDSDWQ